MKRDTCYSLVTVEPISSYKLVNMDLCNATDTGMAMIVIFIDIWQQCTQKRTGFVIPFVIDILVAGLPKYLTYSAKRLAHNSEHYLILPKASISIEKRYDKFLKYFQ